MAMNSCCVTAVGGRLRRRRRLRLHAGASAPVRVPLPSSSRRAPPRVVPLRMSPGCLRLLRLGQKQGPAAGGGRARPGRGSASRRSGPPDPEHDGTRSARRHRLVDHQPRRTSLPGALACPAGRVPAPSAPTAVSAARLERTRSRGFTVERRARAAPAGWRATIGSPSAHPAGRRGSLLITRSPSSAQARRRPDQVDLHRHRLGVQPLLDLHLQRATAPSQPAGSTRTRCRERRKASPIASAGYSRRDEARHSAAVPAAVPVLSGTMTDLLDLLRRAQSAGSLPPAAQTRTRLKFFRPPSSLIVAVTLVHAAWPVAGRAARR